MFRKESSNIENICPEPGFAFFVNTANFKKVIFNYELILGVLLDFRRSGISECTDSDVLRAKNLCFGREK